MNAKHIVIGGGVASALAGLVAVLSKGRVHLTTDEAVLYGGWALAAGAGIAHRIDQVGLRGFFSGVWRGNQTQAPPAK